MKNVKHNQYLLSPDIQFGPVQLPRSCGFQPGPEAQADGLPRAASEGSRAYRLFHPDITPPTDHLF